MSTAAVHHVTISTVTGPKDAACHELLCACGWIAGPYEGPDPNGYTQALAQDHIDAHSPAPETGTAPAGPCVLCGHRWTAAGILHLSPTVCPRCGHPQHGHGSHFECGCPCADDCQPGTAHAGNCPAWTFSGGCASECGHDGCALHGHEPTTVAQYEELMAREEAIAARLAGDAPQARPA